MYFYTLALSFLLFSIQNGRKLHTMTATDGGTLCGLQQYNKYSNIIFSFVCALKAHTRKKINDIEELRPTERGRSADCVVYGYFNGFFFFAGREKTKKKRERGSRGEGRRRHGWRCAGGVPGGGCGPVGGIWYTLNQSINVYRIYCGVLWLLNVILHRLNFAPAAGVDLDGMTAAGGEAGRRAGGAIPPP
jgi:hypothetical protein